MKISPRQMAILFSIFGFAMMLLVLQFMHSPIVKRKIKEPSQVQFEVKKVKRKQQKIKKRKPKKKKMARRSQALKPRLDLAFASGGLDLGVDILGLTGKDSSLLNSGNAVMTEDVVDQRPQVQHREPIPFPELAKEKNINGSVTVNLLINEEGRVEQVRLLNATPEGVFEQVALDGVKSWSFTPAEYQGRFVSVWVKQKIKFQVN